MNSSTILKNIKTASTTKRHTHTVKLFYVLQNCTQITIDNKTIHIYNLLSNSKNLHTITLLLNALCKCKRIAVENHYELSPITTCIVSHLAFVCTWAHRQYKLCLCVLISMSIVSHPFNMLWVAKYARLALKF